MDPSLQREAQQRADRIAAFRAELADLEREGGLTLTSDQRARLETHQAQLLAALNRQYGIDVDDSTRRISWGMRLTSLLGGAALFAALVLFLHRIWGALAFPVQVGVLTAVPLMLVGATAWAFRKGAAPYYLALLGLAAGGAFVMAVNALGALYNLAPSPQALLAWGAVGVLLAYAYGVRLLLGAGLLLLAVYAGALGVEASGAFWGSFPDRPAWLLPGAVALYAIPELARGRQSPEFEFVYRFCGAGLGLVALLALSKSGDVCCTPARVTTVETLYQLTGLLLSVGVVAHGLRLGRSGLVNLGAVAFAVYLFVRLHAWWWDWMPKYLFFLCLALTAGGLLMGFQRVRRRLAPGRSP